MLHDPSRKSPSKPTKTRQSARQSLLVTLLAVVTLGGMVFSVSSISVHSSDTITKNEPSINPTDVGAPASLPRAEVNRASAATHTKSEARTFQSLFATLLKGGASVRTDDGHQLRLSHRAARLSVLPTLLLPSITATKRDTLTGDVNNDGIANPGDTLTYTVTITNNGTTDATDVVFTDTPDNNTTVVPGSVRATPIAVDDSYTATGNVRISAAAPGLLANDNDPEGDAITASAGATSAQGGDVVVNADGSFSYNPKPGFEGNDTFNYTVTDSHGNTNTGTVTVTVSGMIWFVNSTAATNGDGRLTSPYNCLTGPGCFDPAAPDDPGDNIFLYSGSYTGGVTLLANEKLIGQGSTNSLATIAGITPAPGSDPLPSTSGANPVITTTAPATNGINLGTGNLIRGLTVHDTTGAGINGAGFGSLVIREVTISGLGQALNLNNGSLDAGFGSISSTDSASTGITLASVSGSLTSGPTTITNPTGVGIQVTSLGAGVTGVDFGNTTVNSSGGTGVVLQNNTGKVTFADLDIAPDSGQRGLQASNNVATASPGQITITSGTIATTNAVAVDIAGASAAIITPLSVVLDSVSTTGGSSGINLSFTDGPGGFTVQGSGTTAASGGTITNTQQGAVFNTSSNITLKNMNFTNANTLDGGAAANCDGTTNINCKAAINLQTVTGATLDGLNLTQGVENGINIRTVSNLTVNNTTVQNFGDAVNEGPVRAINLTGTSAFTNSTFKFGFQRVADLTNNTGSLNLTINNSTFSDTQTSASGAEGIILRSQLTSNVALTVTNSSFLRLRTVGINGQATGTAVFSANITGSTFDRGLGIGRAVDLSSDNSSTMSFNINNNPLMNSNGGNVITVTGFTTSNFQGRINNNPNIQAGGASTSGSGIVVSAQNSSNGIVEITGNTISNIGVDIGISAFSRSRAVGGPPGGRLDATITNNTVTANPAASAYAIATRAGGGTATDQNTTCANVANNTTTPGSIAAFQARVANANSTLLLQGFNTNATTTWNNNGNLPLNSVDDSGVPANISGGTCNVPSNPSAMLFDQSGPGRQVLAQATTNDTLFKAGSRAALDAKQLFTTAETFSHAVSMARANASQPASRPAEVTEQSATNHRQATMSHAPRVRPMLVKPSMAGSVNLNIGTIPAGESVTITFQVTINNPMSPTNTTQVSNQGTVSGSNFGAVLTDDPDTAAPGDPTVTPVVNPNNPPDAVDDTATVAEDSGANAINVLANDTDADGNTLTITGVTQGANGSVAITGGGTGLTYTPNANYFGPDSFTYTISDGNGGTDTATVSVNVTSVNDNPTANDDSATVAEDSGANAINVLANDSFAPDTGETLTISTVTQGTNGSVAITGGGTGLTYTPNPNFFGTDSFTYTIGDGNGGSDTATVSITVTNVNDDPTANDDTATVAEDSGANTINVLANDSSAPDTGETLTITTKTNGANGSVAITGGGTAVTYTPNPDFFGSDSFTYTISDGNGGSDTATVNVTVTNVNDNPTANDDSATVAEDSGANAINVLANDSISPDAGETLTISAVTQGTNGSVAITGGGTGLTYTPNANYFGPDSFTYTVSDGNGGSDTATVSITVTNVNDPPDAVNDSATMAEDSGANAINVLANDTFVPDAGETLTIVAVTQGANGSVAITGGGTGVTYTPNANFFGTDSFTYTISDGNGGNDTATVSITVTPVNDAPVANAGPDQTASCTGVVTLDGTATSDVDDPSSTLVYVWKEGSTVIATGPSPTVVLPVGVHTITLTVTDPHGASSQDTVVITVVDDSLPVITLTNQQYSLWPPNHQYVSFNIGNFVASASDACDPSVDINDVVITKVTSDENENGNSDGNTLNDIIIAANCKSVQLRSERNGSSNGRVYTIFFSVTDTAGNTTIASTKVIVPRNYNGTAVDDGPKYTVTSNCP